MNDIVVQMVLSGHFSPFVAACQILHYADFLLPLVRALGSLKRQRVFIANTGHAHNNIIRNTKKNSELYLVEPLAEAQLCFAAECWFCLFWLKTSNCLVPNLILNYKKNEETCCNYILCFSNIYI